MKHIRIIFFLTWCFVVELGFCFAQDFHEPPKPESKSSFTLNRALYEQYKQDRDFDYDSDPQLKSNFWTEFREWLFPKIRRFFRFNDSTVFDWVVWSLLMILLIVAAWLIYRSNPGGVFYIDRKNKSKVEYSTHSISALDFKRQFEEALQAENHREAIRFAYLYSLHLLKENRLIQFGPNKTPGDYLSQIENQAIRDSMKELSFFYTYIWYGNFPVRPSDLEIIRVNIDAIINQLNHVEKV